MWDKPLSCPSAPSNSGAYIWHASASSRDQVQAIPADWPNWRLPIWVPQYVDLADILTSLWRPSSSIGGPRFDVKDDPHERLIRDFPVGGKVYVNKSNGSGYGTFALTDIPKGDIVMQISRADRISSSAAATPELRAHIEEIRERIGGPVPTADHILTVVAFLLEVDKGSASHFDSYIATLPRRDMMNQTGWYWAAAELECVVPRHTLTNVQRQQATLRNLRTAMKQLSNVPPLSRLSSDVLDLATWGSLLVETRGFHTIDGVSLQPILDMANHDPTQTVSPFSMKTGTDYLVATRDIQRGEQVYNSYGPLSALETAEHYGFVDPHTPYVAAPSLSIDLQTSDFTRGILPCQRTMTFFGNVSGSTSQASFQHLKQFVHFEAFRPSQLTYECLRVLLQSEDGPTLARYVARRVQSDVAAYEAMAGASRCQGTGGNFELIRRANEQTATLLRGVVEEAQRAARGAVNYVDVAYQ